MGAEAVAREVLTDDFLFHGSLRADRKGIDGFVDYAERVRNALGDYRFDVGEKVEEPDLQVIRHIQ